MCPQGKVSSSVSTYPPTPLPVTRHPVSAERALPCTKSKDGRNDRWTERGRALGWLGGHKGLQTEEAGGRAGVRDYQGAKAAACGANVAAGGPYWFNLRTLCRLYLDSRSVPPRGPRNPRLVNRVGTCSSALFYPSPTLVMGRSTYGYRPLKPSNFSLLLIY